MKRHRTAPDARRRISMIAAALVMTLCCEALAAPAANTWNRIRYGGGTVQAKVDPYDWNTTLTVTADNIVMVFGHRMTLNLKPGQVTALSYGREAHRRVADMVTLSLFFTPLALFGILHESKMHYIGIEFTNDDNKRGAVLLEVHKDSYRAILEALKSVTGKPVRTGP